MIREREREREREIVWNWPNGDRVTKQLFRAEVPIEHGSKWVAPLIVVGFFKVNYIKMIKIL